MVIDRTNCTKYRKVKKPNLTDKHTKKFQENLNPYLNDNVTRKWPSVRPCCNFYAFQINHMKTNFSHKLYHLCIL